MFDTSLPHIFKHAPHAPPIHTTTRKCTACSARNSVDEQYTMMIISNVILSRVERLPHLPYTSGTLGGGPVGDHSPLAFVGALSALFDDLHTRFTASPPDVVLLYSTINVTPPVITHALQYSPCHISRLRAPVQTATTVLSIRRLFEEVHYTTVLH